MAPYTRAEFDQQRAKARSVSKALGRVTAIAAVTLGVGQLLVIRLLAGRIVRSKELAFELALFVTYIVVVGFLVWRMDREVTNARPRCPQCGKRLKAAAEDIAGATGKCTHCGGQVIA